MSKRDPARAATKAMLREYAARRNVAPPPPARHLVEADDTDNAGGAPPLDLLDDPLDPRAAVSAARAKRWLERVRQDRDAEQVWTVNEVKWRLEEAMRIGEKVVRRDGPRQKTGFWPDPDILGDISDFDRNTWYEGQRDGTRDPDPVMRSVAMSASEVEISRFEQAIMWPIHYLGADRFERERMVLMSWLKALARREPWRRWMIEPEGTSYRVRWHALVLITCGLIRDKARMV